MIKALMAEDLKRLIQQENEDNYLIVDVRQPQEFRLDHIPGSVNIPLAEIQLDPYVFEDNRKLIFCCTRGSRSKVAAIFVAETGYNQDRLFHLHDGMFEYTGEILLDIPKVELFSKEMAPLDAMEKALDFEKGAYKFYMLAKEKVPGTPLYNLLTQMAADEHHHAKSIFKQIKKLENLHMDFEAYFQACKGEILEGGKPFREVKDFLSKTHENACMDIVEFAIELEYGAYDLNKTVSEELETPSLKEMFVDLAQAEKSHLDQMISALELCQPDD